MCTCWQLTFERCVTFNIYKIPRRPTNKTLLKTNINIHEKPKEAKKKYIIASLRENWNDFNVMQKRFNWYACRNVFWFCFIKSKKKGGASYNVNLFIPLCIDLRCDVRGCVAFYLRGPWVLIPSIISKLLLQQLVLIYQLAIVHP